MFDDKALAASEAEGRYRAIIPMAQAYLWRIEVEKFKFRSVVYTLQGLGLLTEMQVAQIDEVIDEDLYPEDESDDEDETAKG